MRNLFPGWRNTAGLATLEDGGRLKYPRDGRSRPRMLGRSTRTLHLTSMRNPSKNRQAKIIMTVKDREHLSLTTSRLCNAMNNEGTIRKESNQDTPLRDLFMRRRPQITELSTRREGYQLGARETVVQKWMRTISHDSYA